MEEPRSSSNKRSTEHTVIDTYSIKTMEDYQQENYEMNLRIYDLKKKLRYTE